MDNIAPASPAPNKKQRLVLAAAWLAVLALVVFSTVLRMPAANTAYVNQDATWHVVHTMHCYDGIDASEHLFLPLVTPNDDARGIGWGATTADENGIYYYSSFWPAGFVLPWLFAKLAGLAYTPATLYVLNCILYAASAAVCALLMQRLFRGRLHPAFILLFSAGLYLFQPEVMQSQGGVYWPHSASQLLLLLQLLCFAHFARTGGKIGFYALCLLAPLFEWSGFVAAAGFGLVLLFFGAPGSPKPRFALRFGQAAGAVGAAGLALVCALLHYLQRLPFGALWAAWTGSYGARSENAANPFLQWLVMMFRSFRYLWLLLGVLLVLVLALKPARRALPGVLRAFWPWLLVSAFPMLENLLLRQHAVEYSYDRMKAVTPLILAALMLACCLVALPLKKWGPRLVCGGMAAGMLLGGALGMWQYLRVPNRYIEQAPYMDANQALADHLLQSYPREDCFYASNLTVRGYANTLFEGGIMELASLEAARTECMARGKRYLVYLDAAWGTSNTGQYQSALVEDTQTGLQQQLEAAALVSQ